MHRRAARTQDMELLYDAGVTGYINSTALLQYVNFSQQLLR